MWIPGALASTWLMLVSFSSIAQPVPQRHGQELVIGQTAAFTGAPAASVREMTIGARLVFDAVNAKGGIGGKKLRLVSLDDGFDPKRAASNAELLINQFGAQALLLSRGTPTTQAMLPVLERSRVPLVGPSSGAMVLHTPVNPWVFNIRSTYQREAEKIILQLTSMGIDRIGVIAVADSFGNDALEGINAGFRQQNLQHSFAERFPREQKDFSRLIDVAATKAPGALVVIGATEPSLSIIKGLRQRGYKRFVATLSTNASSGFLRSLGPDGAGVIVAQVFPGERSLSVPFIKEAHELLSKSLTVGNVEGTPIEVTQALRQAREELVVSPALLEGFVSAKVMVTAIANAGPDVTPLSIKRSLESGQPFDIGWPGNSLRFTPTNHTGLSFSDLSVVSGQSQFRR